MLVDGGVLDPVPVAPVASASADLVVAVNLAGRGPIADRPVSASASEGEEDTSEGLRRSAARWFDSDLMASVRRRLPADLEDSVRAHLEKEREAKPDMPGSLEVMQLSAEAMQAALTRHRLAAHPPDVLINVPKHAARTLQLHKAEEMIELGRDLARDALAPWFAGPDGPSAQGAAGPSAPDGAPG
jgi:NTE family protein